MSKSKKKSGSKKSARSVDGVIQEALGKRISSSAFLAYVIIMALTGVAYTVSIFETPEINALTALTNGSIAVCALVTAIVGILFYAKKIAVKGKTVKLLGIYYTAQKIMAAASCVFGGIVSVCVFLIGGIGGALMLIFKNVPDLIGNIVNVIEFMGFVDTSKAPDSLDALRTFLSVGGIALISASVIFAVLTFLVLINNIIAFKNNGKYIKSLAEACDTNIYDVKKIPNKRSSLFGILYIVFGIISIVFALKFGFGIAAILVGVMFIFDSLIFNDIHADILTATEANVAKEDGDNVVAAKAAIAAEAKRILIEKERTARIGAVNAAAAAKFAEEQAQIAEEVPAEEVTAEQTPAQEAVTEEATETEVVEEASESEETVAQEQTEVVEAVEPETTPENNSDEIVFNQLSPDYDDDIVFEEVKSENEAESVAEDATEEPKEEPAAEDAAEEPVTEDEAAEQSTSEEVSSDDENVEKTEE